MLVKLKRQVLVSAMQHIAAGLSAKPVIPVLSGVKVQAGEAELTLTASNIAMTLQYKAAADGDNLAIEKTGNIVVPARYFMDIVRNIPDEFVTIEEMGNRQICISSGRTVYRLSTMNAEEFPETGAIENKAGIHIDSDCFKRMVKQVSFAASSSEARIMLTGVLFQTDGPNLKLAATDGICLASRTRNVNASQTAIFPPTVIPAKHLYDYSKMISDGSGVTEVALGDNGIRFTTDNFTMYSSLIRGTYPSIDKLTPNRFHSEITLDTSQFLHAVERVSLLSGEANVVGLRISPIGIELFARSEDIGDVTEVIPFEASLLEPMTVSFNGKYMREIMRAIDSEYTQLKFTGKDKPITVQPFDRQNDLYIITPIRTLSS